MTTWREARAAKDTRQRRERRYFTPDRLGSPCPRCRLRMPLVLEAAGMRSHPTCIPREAWQ